MQRFSVSALTTIVVGLLLPGDWMRLHPKATFFFLALSFVLSAVIYGWKIVKANLQNFRGRTIWFFEEWNFASWMILLSWLWALAGVCSKMTAEGAKPSWSAVALITMGGNPVILLIASILLFLLVIFVDNQEETKYTRDEAFFVADRFWILLFSFPIILFPLGVLVHRLIQVQRKKLRSSSLLGNSLRRFAEKGGLSPEATTSEYGKWWAKKIGSWVLELVVLCLKGLLGLLAWIVCAAGDQV